MRKILWGLVICGGLSACSDDGGSVVAVGESAVEARIDKRGGELELQDEARLSIPRGALEEPTTLRAERGDLDRLPRLGDDLEVAGEPLVVTPHGLELRERARIEQVVTREDADPGALRVLRLDDEEDDTWEEIRSRDIQVLEPGERSDDRDLAEDDSVSDKRRVSFEVEGFSIFLPVLIPNALCADREAGDVCRPSAGPCDVAEECDGESDYCPIDTFAEGDVVCRESAGGCDVAETCTGNAAECPDDSPNEAGSVCRPSAGGCDVAEVCDGESFECPANAFREAGFVCREQNGACDAAEVCSGEAAACPDDAFLPAQTLCQEAADCNAASFCTGRARSCPVALPAQQGTPCDDGNACTLGDSCNGLGACNAGASSPCDAFVGDTDTDCNEACVENANVEGGYECTGQEENGTFCQTQACAVAACNAGTCEEQLPCPVYVSVDGGMDDAGTPCGDSWGTACRSVQKGSNVALDAGNPRVFVAKGTYEAPGGGTVLAMAEGTEYYGSFDGTEDAPEQRTLTVPDAGVGPDPASSSVLNAAGSPLPVVRGASNARLDGFTVTDLGGSSGDGMRNQGNQKAATRLTGLTVANTRFHGGTTGAARGMYNSYVEDLTVENSAFDSNEAQTSSSKSGAGMYIYDATNVTITDSRFVGNSINAQTGSLTVSARGAGLYAEVAANLRLDTVEFRDNTAAAASFAGSNACLGGAMALRAGDADLRDVTFRSNQCLVSGGKTAGGALYIEDTSPSTLSSVRFIDNRAAGTSVETSVDSAEGGGFAIEADDGNLTATLANVEFQGNSVSGASGVRGGGLSVRDVNRDTPPKQPNVDVTLTGARFEANQVYGYGDVAGGGLFAQAANGTLTVEDALFAHHTLPNVQGTPGGGGGLLADVAQVTLSDVDFVNNQVSASYTGAEGGGALLLGNMASNASADLSAVRFVDNRVTAGSYYSGIDAQGGGLSTREVATTLTDSDFLGNLVSAFASSSGGTAGAYGAGLHHFGGEPLTATNVSFVGNRVVASALTSANAIAEGGGVGINSSSSYSFDNATFVNNTGGGLYAGANSGEVYNSIFANQGYDIDSAPAPSAGVLCTSTPGGSDVALTYPVDSMELTTTDGGHVFLPATSPCIDVTGADDTRADAVFAPVDWRTLTTRLDGTLDMPRVDMGRHYLPGQPVILSFTESSGTLSWSLQQPPGTTCALSDENVTPEVAVSTASGSLSNHDFSGRVWLSCVNGRASAWASVFVSGGGGAAAAQL